MNQELSIDYKLKGESSVSLHKTIDQFHASAMLQSKRGWAGIAEKG